MEKNFSLYLTKIGLFDEDTSKNLINSKNDSKVKSFIDTSFYYLMNFFDNLTESQKKYMSYFIPNNYKKMETNFREKKIKSLFIQKLLRQKLLLLKQFLIWKKNINLYENKLRSSNNEVIQKIQASQNNTSIDDYIVKEENNKKKELSNIKNILNSINIKPYTIKNERTFNKKNNKRLPYDYYNNYNNQYLIDNYKTTTKIRKPNYKYIYNNLYQSSLTKKENRNKNRLLTSLESKELEDLKECTFKPRINIPSTSKEKNILNKNKSKENIISIFDKLYKDEEKKKLNKELRTIDREYTLGKNFSFTPNLGKRFNRVYRYQDHKNFAQRQREYKEKLDKKKEELRDELDSRYELICSFNPKITNEKGEYYISKRKKSSENKKQPSSVFKRLYLDVANRQNIKEQKEQENIDKFDELANYLTKDKKVDDSVLIERLRDFNKEDIINKTREKVDKEEGITFQPEIGDNDYNNNVEGTFLERNEQWLLNRNNFIEEENSKQIENLRYGGPGKKKKYTSEEREQIISNIIERLYESHKEKKKENENSSQEEEEEDNNENEENEEEQGEE